MAKNSLQRYLAKIGKEFDVVLTEENYKEVILEEVESPPALLEYLRDYMEKNEPTLEWSCLMFLFIRNKSFEHYEKAVINHQTANKPKELKARSLYNLAVIKINVERDYEEAERLLKENHIECDFV